MKSLSMLALAAPIVMALTSAAVADAQTDAVHYLVRTEANGDKLAELAVTVTMPAHVGESLVLDLPRLLAADRIAARLTVDGAEVDPATANASVADKLQIRATATAVTLHYRLRSDGSDSPLADQDNPQRDPALRNFWFSLKGEQALVLPEGHERRAATLDVDNVPPGWMVTTSVSGPTSVADVADSLMIGGRHYLLMQRVVGSATLRLAYPAALKDTAADLMNTSAQVLMAEWKFWQAPAQPFFIGLVQMKNGQDFGGRGLHGGFALYMGDRVPRTEWLHLIAHENLHTWISRRIGGFPAQDDDLEAWLNEGFTEAYTARILLEAGLWTPAQFVADWNHALVRYGASPARGESNTRILADRHRDPDIEWLPYDRGRILAVLWDRKLRNVSHGRVGLDDVMRAQVLRAAMNDAKGDAVSADALLPIVVRQVSGMDLSTDIASYVDRGDLPVLPENAFGPCVKVVQVTRPAFDHGFDFLATVKAHGRLTGLETGGPAERAGLREGDRLHFDEVYSNDSTLALSYGVDNADGTRRQVSYKPEGPRSVTLQQLEWVPASNPDDRCKKGMATP
jgi:predicted metalloprotease with PDZ domain